MKICFLADGRSPHAQNWIRPLGQAGHEVHLISTYPFDSERLGLASLHVVPLDFSARARAGEKIAGAKNARGKASVLSRLRGGRIWARLAGLRDSLAPLAVSHQRSRVQKIVAALAPDIVHAMRVPFEGMLAAQALENVSVPLVVSIWGNDFTLYARRSPRLARLTRQAMRRADALHPDCARDLRLAGEFGFDLARPAVVLPGGGGVRASLFHPGPKNAALAARWNIPPDAPVVLNPRGLKPYIRSDIFFQAIPRVLARCPDVVFLGAQMHGIAAAEQQVAQLGITSAVRLLPVVSHDEMADFFRLADVAVSPSEHDGTPNTLLEAMACGAYPVAGDIESVREWVTDGENGRLCDPGDPDALAEAILAALNDEVGRKEVARRNAQMVAARVDSRLVTAQAEAFYREILGWVPHFGKPTSCGRQIL